MTYPLLATAPLPKTLFRAMSLQRLCQLDKLFAERLDTLLHDEECVRGLMELEGDELTQLVDYLSDVGLPVRNRSS